VNDDNQNNSDEYWDDLFEWFDGECSPERAAAIARWVESHPDVARRVERERAHWERLKRAVSPLEKVDTLSSLQRLQARREAIEQAPAVDEQRTPPITPRRIRFWHSDSPMKVARIAAAIVALFGGGIWIAQMEHGDGRAAARTSEFAAARGERVHITLPDGSHVTLAPESRLKYTAHEDRGSRVVELLGRAYFEVIHNPDRPFSVRTGSTETDDVGTHFLVEAYPGDVQVRVAVAEGEVAIRGDSAPSVAAVHLTGGESAVVERGRVVSKARMADAAEYAAWGQGAIRLHDVSLMQVARELSRWYDLDVHVNDQVLAGQRLSITIGGEPPDQILAIISRATNARYTRRGNLVVLQSR
jgi:transmembrane sensor